MMRDWGVCRDCALKENCAEYKPYKRQCEDYERYKEVLTHEEWLRQCNTEELVKMILDLCDYRPCFACGIGYCDDEDWCHVYSEEAKEFVMEWLKQPHTEKE